ncbi:MAG: DUF2141 domain-containing protein [Flavobacteriaceae bacterium]|jgi:uncharacterized protein (DUF2141 family)
MVRVVTLLVMYLVSQLIYAQSVSTEEKLNEGQTIKVTVPSVLSSEGDVKFALYVKEGFLTRPIMAKSGKIVDKTSNVEFENVQPGEYAIVCYHDKNSNNKLDFNEMGMPLEDYGSSNNVYRMGPPTFEDAKFTVENKSLDLTIKF